MKTTHPQITIEFQKTIFTVLLSLILMTSCNNDKNDLESVSENDEQTLTEMSIPNAHENLKDIFTDVEQAPVFGTTPNALNTYIATELKYPQEAKEKGIQGTVYVSFTVDNTGKVCQVEVSKSANKILDDEAVRVISSMPKWQPGMNEGKAVNVKLNLPIKFLLQ